MTVTSHAWRCKSVTVSPATHPRLLEPLHLDMRSPGQKSPLSTPPKAMATLCSKSEQSDLSCPLQSFVDCSLLRFMLLKTISFAITAPAPTMFAHRRTPNTSSSCVVRPEVWSARRSRLLLQTKVSFLHSLPQPQITSLHVP